GGGGGGREGGGGGGGGGPRDPRHDRTRVGAQLVAGEPDDLWTSWQGVDHGAEVGVVPALDGEEQARPGARQDVADLAAPVARVDPGGDRAEARRRQVGDEVERRGRQEQRDDVPLPHAARRQTAREAIREPVPVAGRPPRRAIPDRLGV